MTCTLVWPRVDKRSRPVQPVREHEHVRTHSRRVGSLGETHSRHSHFHSANAARHLPKDMETSSSNGHGALGPPLMFRRYCGAIH